MNFKGSLFGRSNSLCWQVFFPSLEHYTKNNLNPNLIGVFYFPIFVKNTIMSPNLKELIDTNQVSEIEVVEFIATLRKLSHKNVLDNRNYKLVLEHFGLKKKKGWIKFGNGSKYKI